MTYADEWRRLSGRIRGLMQAGELHARFLGVRSGDTFGRAGTLGKHCEGVLAALEVYLNTYEAQLPDAASTEIRDFVHTHADLIRRAGTTQDCKQERVWAALILLAGLEAEISYALFDTQEIIRARSERAFAHLQRLIVADPSFGEKWKVAFQNGEVACEKLGAVHLLLHGIFAFKVNAEGERTDLVFQDPIEDATDEQRYADGLVLTEWKIARSKEEATSQFRSAKIQAGHYGKGALGGSELTRYRYLVVVSCRQVAVPPDLTEDSVHFRHINIAVEPQTPSQRS